MALLSRAAVARDLRSGRFVERRFRRTPVRRPLSLLHRGVERLPPAAAALRQLLIERADETQRLITRGAGRV
jgi:DNA-binding transcriptional LysR family regulator